MLTDEEKDWEEINKMDTIVPGEQYVAVDRAILSTFANYWNFPELKSLLKGSTSDCEDHNHVHSICPERLSTFYFPKEICNSKERLSCLGLGDGRDSDSSHAAGS